MAACLHGHIGVVRLLLDHNANIEATHSSHWTPLMLAARRGHVNIVKLLLNRNAKLEPRRGQWGPLLIAPDKGHVKVVKLLLDRGANIEATQLDQLMPLMVAA